MSKEAKGKEKKKERGPLDDLKEEIAQELGLWPKVKKRGWGGLTASESGRVGGLMTKRLRADGLIPPGKKTGTAQKDNVR